MPTIKKAVCNVLACTVAADSTTSGTSCGDMWGVIDTDAANVPAPFFMGTSIPLAAAENKRKLSCTRLQIKHSKVES